MPQPKTTELTIANLEESYNRSQELDIKVFNEMKSNILLHAGKHFAKKSGSNDRSRRGGGVSREESRIRLVKNHLHKICNKYKNNILSHCPGVTVSAKNMAEIRDKKDAELSLSVLKDIDYRHNNSQMVEDIVDDFVILGEAWILSTYSPDGGELIGYEGKDVEVEIEVEGQKVMTIEQEIDKTRPVFEGDFEFEIIPGYDVFRDPGAVTLDKARWLGIRRMVDRKEIEAQIDADDSFDAEEKFQKKQMLRDSNEKDNYNIFCGSSAQVVENVGMVLLKTYYYKPSAEAPRGMIYVTTSAGIIWQMELSLDRFDKPIFPLLNATFDKYRGSARGFSKIKQIRPGQAEINRTTSKIAETQITLGDDKVYTTIGGGISEGAKLPGVREVKVKAGMKPEVVPGRSGAQYFEYMTFSINDLYRQMDVTDDSEGKDIAPDITSTLYRSLKEKKKYTLYSSKIERLLIEWAKLKIRIAKKEYRDDKVIRAVGRNEAINIAEFKEAEEMNYSIKVEAMSEDIDSVMGKYMVTRDMIQYAGGQLSPEQIGRAAASGMPFIDARDAFGGLIQERETIESILLQLDRGEQPFITKFDKNDKIVEAIVERMQSNEFKYLTEQNPEIFENYMTQYQDRTEILSKQAEELKSANLGMIPTGGVQVKVDAWVPDPNSKTGKPMRATVDQVALDWFFKQLGQQGAQMEDLQESGPQTQIDVLSGGQNNVLPIGQ